MGTLVVSTSLNGTTGQVWQWYDYKTWAQILAGPGNYVTSSSVSFYPFYFQCAPSDATGYYTRNSRSVFLFDTSALTSAATVTAASFSGYVQNLSSTFYTQTSVPATARFRVYASNPASTSSLAATDYTTFGSTPYSNQVYYSSLTVDTRFSTNLNPTGLAAISKTGLTKFGTREENYDVNGNAPAWDDSSQLLVYIYYNFGVPAYSPLLTITYTGDPTVTTQAASSLLPTSVLGNGNITDVGGASVTRRGFCYFVGTSGDPTTADSVAFDDGTFSAGAYSKTITGLTESTNYRVRSYAVNSVGTAYGSTVQVATPSSTFVKTFNGVARASIKTFHGVTSASIKKWNGVT